MGFLKNYIRMNGLRYTLRRGGLWLSEHALGTWHRAWRRRCPTAEELAHMRAHLPEAGLASVVVPVYNTDPAMLRALLDSLLAQVYASWECCLLDGGDRPDTARVLDEFARRDPRFRVRRAENGGISRNTNLAAAMARGPWLFFCDHDDLLPPEALWRCAQAIAAHPEADLLYTDEDRVPERGGRHTDPHLKPSFEPDTLNSNNYLCHLMAVRKTAFDAAGGLDPAYDSSQDHELALRLSETARGVIHVPHVCYHWRRVRSSVSQRGLQACWAASCRAVEAHMGRLGFPVRAEIENGAMRLRYDVPADLPLTALLTCEDDAERANAGRLLAQLRAERPGLTGQILSPAEAADALARARDDLVLALRVRADTRLSDGFLTELLMYGQRPDVAQVSPVTLDRRGRVLEAGLVRAPGGALAPRFRGLLLRAGGFHKLALMSVNVAAVSGDCVLTRRSLAAAQQPPADDGYVALPRRALRVVTPWARLTRAEIG